MSRRRLRRSRLGAIGRGGSGKERTMDSLVGQRLGAYLLEEEIGKGSMGVVYRATHMEKGTVAAVKVLLDALASDEAFVTRFTREARIIRSLQHPNILRMYDTGQDQGYL